MPSAPPSPALYSTARKAVPWIVRMGEPTAAVTALDECIWAHVGRISKQAGAGTLDYVELTVDLATLGQHLEDIQTPTGFSRQVWIGQIHLDAMGDEEFDTLFFGELAKQNISIDPRRESAVLTCRVEPWMFGDPISGYYVTRDDGVDITNVRITDDITFSPVIDDIVKENQASTYDSAEEPVRYYWLDPGSTETQTARDHQGQIQQQWQLYEAVFTLCWLLNPDEYWCKNPTSEELSTILFDDASDGDATVIENLRLKRGMYLPECLDALLIPRGYNWWVKHGTNEAGDGPILTLCFYKVGVGAERQVNAQAYGETLSLASSNATGIDVEWNIADLANVVTGHGSHVEREITIELYRAWAEADDALTAEQLDKSNPSSQYLTKRNVWRKWVMNEAGDYNSLRTVTQAIPAAPRTLSSVFGSDVSHKRRQFFRCLTLDLNSLRRRPYLQYYDGAAWQAFPGEDWKGATWHLLDRECGILLTADVPCPDLREYGNNARLRITACIRGDARLTHTETRTTNSPNANSIEVILDLHDRFHDRALATGTYASALVGDANGTDARDDADELETYLEAVQAVTEPARLEASFEIFGIDTTYKLGDLLTEVHGRGISLNRYSQTSLESEYLQITGIDYDLQRQRTMLRASSQDRRKVADILLPEIEHEKGHRWQA